MSQSDPTDDALATIASILENQEPPRPSEKAAAEDRHGVTALPGAHGYSKVGPGPIASIRLKWTVRHDSNGQYFVDETIGDSSGCISHGPMSADAAVRFVDDQASEARQRFEALRSEMTSRAAAMESLHDEGDED